MEEEMTAHEMITITTKRKIGKKKMNEIFDSMIDILGDNLETAGGKPISTMQHLRVWMEARE